MPTQKRSKMSKIRKISAVLGIKGLLAVASLTTVAIALVMYTASVTITPTTQFTLGASTDSWNVYVNDVNQVRYLPGGSTPPVDTSAYAFSLDTTNRGCAVRIELTAGMSSALFSNFDITVMYWQTGSGWTSAQLYDSATGGSVISSIDGTTLNAGFIRQGQGTGTTYYLVQVLYSYDLVDTTSAVTATFQYTPLPS
ncbi:hypothetical protein E2P60_00245 [Candidatus Bathyarchaeota archaeon]|nr:hypothetical protein E2P60_00245 [Candidatus Bathyarchaeota archaeon]